MEGNKIKNSKNIIEYYITHLKNSKNMGYFHGLRLNDIIEIENNKYLLNKKQEFILCFHDDINPFEYIKNLEEFNKFLNKNIIWHLKEIKFLLNWGGQLLDDEIMFKVTFF